MLKPQQRPNALCPVCGSIESTRTLWFYLSNEVLGKKNKRNFLYFSPEKPILDKLKNHEVQMVTANRNYFCRINASNADGKLKGGFFDVILFVHQLQYVDKEDEALTELHRLLRPGGFVLVMTVVNPLMDRTYESPTTDEDKDRLFHYYESGVVRVYGANIKKHLARSGFRVEAINYPEELGPNAQSYYQLGDGSREVIYKCKK